MVRRAVEKNETQEGAKQCPDVCACTSPHVLQEAREARRRDSRGLRLRLGEQWAKQEASLGQGSGAEGCLEDQRTGSRAMKLARGDQWTSSRARELAWRFWRSGRD